MVEMTALQKNSLLFTVPGECENKKCGKETNFAALNIHLINPNAQIGQINWSKDMTVWGGGY